MEKRTCYPLLLLFKGDHPECKTFVGLKGGSTHHPCSICGRLHAELHRLPEHEESVRRQEDVEDCLKALARLEQEVKEYTAHREQGTVTKVDYSTAMERLRRERVETLGHLKWMSAHVVRCAFWRLGYVDVTLMAAIDLMHLVDLGIIPRILEHTAAYYCAQMDGGLEGLNERWRELEPCDDVPRARRRPLFKIGKGGGIQVCGSLKAHEYKAILQLFPNCVRDDKKVFAVWHALHHWYGLAQKKSFTVADLVELHQAALECVPDPGVLCSSLRLACPEFGFVPTSSSFWCAVSRMRSSSLRCVSRTLASRAKLPMAASPWASSNGTWYTVLRCVVPCCAVPGCAVLCSPRLASPRLASPRLASAPPQQIISGRFSGDSVVIQLVRAGEPLCFFHCALRFLNEHARRQPRDLPQVDQDGVQTLHEQGGGEPRAADPKVLRSPRCIPNAACLRLVARSGSAL